MVEVVHDAGGCRFAPAARARASAFGPSPGGEGPASDAPHTATAIAPKRTFHASAILLAFAALLLGIAGRAGAAEVKRSARGMTYSIRLPAHADRASGGLLVICLHGQGGNNEQFMSAVSGAEFLSDAILVAPNATADAAWAEGDVDLVADLALEVKERYHTHRTIAFGFSRGGYMAFGLGVRRPDRFDAVIPHSGGLAVPIPPDEPVKKEVFCVIHGDSDRVVSVEQSRSAVAALKAAGVSCVKYEEVRGLDHTIDQAATKRAFEWVAATLGPLSPPMDLREASNRIAAVEKALHAKDYDAAARGFDSLAEAPKPLYPKIAALAKANVASAHEPLALAAVAAAGRLGEAGLPALKAALNAKSQTVAVAAATALGNAGGDPATALLISTLATAETSKKPDLEKAIHAALTRITGKEFASAKEWKRWARGKG